MFILKFEGMTDEWLDFIAECRNGKTHRYDIVEGPMADDTVWNYVNDFMTGTITRKQFWALADAGIKKQMRAAEVNHCLSFEQVSDEIIEDYQIKDGTFDTISNCKYTIPSAQDIGKLYSIMIEECASPGEELTELVKIFTSFISNEISNFKTGVYYQNPSYLEASYKEGYLLE